ncbi:MAG: sensor protein KdpD [Spirosomataceae bacterium]
MANLTEQNAQYFLDLIKKSRRGKFKIYIGMSAGVGKTYRMLQEGHSLLRNNVDIQIGFVETHRRPDTHLLAQGLPVIPLRKLFYRGKELEEMDLQAILNLHPEVVLVDELAHTNIQGSKNEKRWQDVLDILNAGINVISAVNIQHLESLNDEVFRITGIEVKETVPDNLLRQADEVVNIDLTADELIARLKEGKIYDSSKIETALKHFFQAEKILQLRELALKEVASQVERKVETQLPKNAGLRPERFLACISSNHKMAKKIVRKTSRLAGYYQGKWYLLYVQTSREATDKIGLAAQRHLLNHFKLATESGGEVIRVRSNEVARTIVETARKHSITTVCIGKPHVGFWNNLTGNSLFFKLLQEVSDTDIDLVVIS